MKIDAKVEVFDDGQEPAACARGGSEHCEHLRFYWAGRLRCIIFLEDILKENEGKREGTFIRPCKACLEARRKAKDEG